MPISAGELVVCINDHVDVTDREWFGLIDEVKAGAARHQGRFDRVFVLVASDGGTPTSAQRAYLSRVLEGQPLRAAVLSGSVRVRVGSQFIRWFARDLKFFGPDDAVGWMDHVGITRAERPAVRRELLALQKTVPTRTIVEIEPFLSA